jgi:2-dehydropantoate 2-reductase
VSGRRFVVVGAGAIGGVVGGRLHEAGQDVVLVARGAHLLAIRRDGLLLRSPDGDRRLRIPAAASVTEAAPTDADVVLLCVKGQDTVGVLDELAGVAPAATPVACLQNGVANEPEALRRFADVYGVTVMQPATHLEPGVVLQWSSPVPGLLDVGRWPRGLDGTASAVVAAWASAGFDSRAVADVSRWKYAKLVMNLGNAADAAYGSAGRDLAGAARAEGRSVLEAAGIDFASAEEDAERRGSLLTMGGIDGAERGGSSTWQSLARGASLEVDLLNGEIVMLGRIHGVPAPVNEALQRTAREMAANGEAPGSRPLP